MGSLIDGGFSIERQALRDDQFARIEHLLPGRPGTVGRNSELGNRLFVDAVIWKFRVGTPWRDLPARFGGWCNMHKRFSRWAVSGVWENLLKVLADDPDNEYAMIDATIVRAPPHSAGALKKGARPSHRPLARLAHDENPRDRRRPWQSAAAHPDRRPSARHYPSRGAAGIDRARSFARRQGV
jgi:transposase